MPHPAKPDPKPVDEETTTAQPRMVVPLASPLAGAAGADAAVARAVARATKDDPPGRPPMNQPSPTPRAPSVLAARARVVASIYTTRAVNSGIDAYGVRLVNELAAKLVGLADELDRYQTTAVDPAAALLVPCPAPNVAAGDSDCHPGESWPCARTRAAWALRGLSADAQVAIAASQARAEMLALDDEEPDDGCPVCGAPTGGTPCVTRPAGSPPGTASCADLAADATEGATR